MNHQTHLTQFLIDTMALPHSELISWHFDHVTNRKVKGITLFTALYLSQGVSLPIAFHLIHKTERVTDPKTGPGALAKQAN